MFLDKIQGCQTVNRNNIQSCCTPLCQIPPPQKSSAYSFRLFPLGIWDAIRIHGIKRTGNVFYKCLLRFGRHV